MYVSLCVHTMKGTEQIEALTNHDVIDTTTGARDLIIGFVVYET